MKRVNFEYLCDLFDLLNIGDWASLSLIDKVISFIEMNVTKIENTANKVPNAVYFLFRKANWHKGGVNFLEVLPIVDMRWFIAITLSKQRVIRYLLHVVLSWSYQCIKRMEVSFFICHWNHPWFFKEIAMDVCAFDDILRIEVNFDILAKSAGVFISHCFAITKGLKHWITC